MDAAPTGTSSNLENRLSSGAPNACSIVCLIAAKELEAGRPGAARGFRRPSHPQGRGGRQRLAELDRRRADRDQGRRIIRNRRDIRSEPRDPDEALHRGRGHRVFLDAAVRARSGPTSTNATNG